MAQIKFKVLSVRTGPSTDRTRIGQDDTFIVYQIEGQQANYVRIPKAEVTDEDIKQAVKENEIKQSAIQGREFTVE